MFPYFIYKIYFLELLINTGCRKKGWLLLNCDNKWRQFFFIYSCRRLIRVKSRLSFVISILLALNVTDGWRCAASNVKMIKLMYKDHSAINEWRAFKTSDLRKVLLSKIAFLMCCWQIGRQKKGAEKISQQSFSVRVVALFWMLFCF